jgi:hypothetical protein
MTHEEIKAELYKLFPPINKDFNPICTAEFVIDFSERMTRLEREECASICDRFQARNVGMQPAECAGAIRARGK